MSSGKKIAVKFSNYHSLGSSRGFRTETRDTNMLLTIGFSDPRRLETHVIVFIRNLDSAYRELLFFER